MPATEFGNGSDQNVLRWSNKLMREAMDKTYFKRFSGTSQDSIIQILTELERSPGDTIKFDLLYQNRGDGVQGDTTLEGYEEALEFYQDSVIIDQLRHAHSFRKMSQQRTVHDLRKIGRESLSTWWAWKLDTMMFAYLAGAVGDGSETASGTLGTSGFAGNAVDTPEATHHLDKTGAVMKLSYLNTAKTLAKTINPRIEPVMVDGQPKYIFVGHPYSINALRTETGEAGWNLIQGRAGVNGPKNPIYTGAMGEYNGIVIHESEYIPTNDGATVMTGFTAQNDKANLLLGKGAGVFAMGNAYDKVDQSTNGGGSFFSYKEEVKDYGNKKGIGSASCFGITKCRFNSKDVGVMRITSTDAAPS